MSNSDIRTSDKLKGQLVKLSFKHAWDNARGFVALAETGTDDFDRNLGHKPDPELDPLAYHATGNRGFRLLRKSAVHSKILFFQMSEMIYASVMTEDTATVKFPAPF